MSVKSRRPSGTMAMPISHTRWAGRRRKSTPSNTSLPSRGRTSPATVFMSVVLPAPLGPTMHAMSPAATESETPHSACAAPYATSRWATSSIGTGSEISGHDLRTRHDLVRRALRKHAAVIEHDDAVGHRQDGTHHVLDEHDRGAAVANPAQDLDRAVDLRGRKAR